MALNLCPDRDSFFAKLGDGNLYDDMVKFVAAFGQLLRDNHEFLVSYKLNLVMHSGFLTQVDYFLCYFLTG